MISYLHSIVKIVYFIETSIRQVGKSRKTSKCTKNIFQINLEGSFEKKEEIDS